MDVRELLDAHGGVGSVAQLRRWGVPAGAIRSMASSAGITRVVRGWYASDRAPAPLVAAVRAGGWSSCASALRLHRVWMLEDSRIHVGMPAHGRPRHDDSRVIRHWRGERPVDNVESPLVALEQLCHCGSLIEIVIAADSMANQRLAPESSILRVLAQSAIGRRAADLFDGSSQSGLETIARVALRRRNIRLTSQVWIDGVGRVDLLIGRRLVLELDGRQWHMGAAYEEDRRRDLALVALGYLVVRVSYQQVVQSWPEVERRLLEIIRRGDHLGAPGRRKVGDSNSAPGYSVASPGSPTL